MSMKAPTPVQKAATAGFPPISQKAPTPFGSSGGMFSTPIASTSVGFPPMSKLAPAPFTSFQGVTKSSELDSTPTKSLTPVEKAPSLFGVAQSSSSAYTASNAAALPTASSTISFGQHSAAFRQSFPQVNKKSSECTRQYENLISQMQQSLKMICQNRPTNVDSTLRSKVERHVYDTNNAVADIGMLRSSVQEWKEISASVLGKKTESSRQLHESQRIITELSRIDQKSFTDFSTEPLDCQSESRRRYLTARMIATKRIIGIAKSRFDVLSALESSEGDKYVLASVLSLYEDVKHFDERTAKTENKAIELVTIQRQSRGTSTRYHLPQKSSRLLAQHTDRSDFDDTDSKKMNNIYTWNSIESEFQKLKIPPVKTININSSKMKCNGQTQRNPDKLRVQATREKTSTFAFSPPLSTKSREGWSRSSRITQQQMQQVSFSPPLDLRETTLNFASPGALSEYGTDPEKLIETMRLNKLGMPQALEKDATAPHDNTLSQSSTSANSSTRNAPIFTDNESFVGHGREKSSNQALSETSSILRSTKESSANFASSYSSSQALFTPDNIKPGPRLSEVTNLSIATISRDSPASTEISQTRNTSTNNSKVRTESDSPDFLTLLTNFLKVHNPEKAHQASHHLEKFKVCLIFVERFVSHSVTWSILHYMLFFPLLPK